VVAAAGFLVGLYLGFFVYLSLHGFETGSDWQYLLLTWGSGSIGAGLAAAVAAPDTGRVLGSVMAVALAVAAVGGGILVAADGGYDQVVFGGIAAALAVTTVAAVRSGTARTSAP
jgi:hypothetical protein